jgi:hypothetical protein
MSLLGARRAADELSRALDGEAGISSGTAALAALAERLRTVGPELEAVAVPREEFRAALRTRLVAVATVQPADAPTPAPGLLAGRRQRVAGVAAGALASVVAVSGVAVASSQALPGDPFYGVKRTTEALQLQLSGDEAAQGDRHLQFAATRLDEVRELVLGREAASAAAATAAIGGSTDWQLVRDTLADMDVETRKGSALLEQVWREDRDPEALDALSDFAARQGAELQALLPLLPGEARGDAEASLGLVHQVAATTSELLVLGSCTEQCRSSSGSSTSGSSDGECDCAPAPSSSPRPSESADPSPSSSPAPAPGSSAPSTGTLSPDPATSSPAAPAQPSSPPGVATVPSLPSVPTVDPTQLPTVSPSLPSGQASVPVPSLDPAVDDLVPEGQADLLPG